MLKSLSSAVSGLQSHQTLMDVIGNNIANVNTNGFQSSRVVFNDVYYQTLQAAGAATAAPLHGGTNPSQIGYGTQIGTIDVLHTTGGMTTTNRTMDQYVDGDGYFIVEMADGSNAYTKLGNLYFDTSGTDANLVDSNGNLICDETGAPITVPNFTDYSSVSISPTGAITGVDNTNTVQTLGQIGLAYFNNQDGLLKTGNGYYIVSANSGAAQITTPGNAEVGSLVSGALAASNVDLSKEFTDMIKAQRGFQANARVITTSDEILQELVNLKR